VLVSGSKPVFKDKKILLLEAAPQKKQHQLPETFNSRVCTLSPGTVQLLQSMFLYLCPNKKWHLIFSSDVNKAKARHIKARDSRKSRQKMAKNTANFSENRKNHGKETASNHGPEDHYTVYKTQDLALTTSMTCNARFSSVKFCRCCKIQR